MAKYLRAKLRFLQLVLSNRLSSTIKAFTRSPPARGSIVSTTDGKIEVGIDLLLCLVVSGQFNYTKGAGFYAFSIAYIIGFSRINILLGVGSFSK